MSQEALFLSDNISTLRNQSSPNSIAMWLNVSNIDNIVKYSHLLRHYEVIAMSTDELRIVVGYCLYEKLKLRWVIFLFKFNIISDNIRWRLYLKL
jgi:hypothetical protein